MENKGFFRFEIIIYVLVSLFRFLCYGSIPGMWGLIALVRIMYKFMSPFILPTYKLAEINSKHVDKGDGNVDIIE